MTTIPLAALDSIVGGNGVCTPDNPTGGTRPTAVLENDRSGPSLGDRVRNNTNTWMTRGMGMLNDGRPTMP